MPVSTGTPAARECSRGDTRSADEARQLVSEPDDETRAAQDADRRHGI
jgi:hypothetical protein